MAAFDVTTKPTSLTLAPGSTGSILVVVSNRLGRPVMGLLEVKMTPPSASGWLVSPPDLQRRYEADPAASVNYDFRVTVPKDAAAQPVEFKAIVRDAMAPDDIKVEGQTVLINVTGDGASPPRKKLPWWIWLIAGLIVVAAAVVIYLICCRNEAVAKVPNVIGMTAEDAGADLRSAGFDSVLARDTIGDQTKDTNRVVGQQPTAGGEMPKESDDKLVATIVVNRVAGRVPFVIGQTQISAVAALTQAGFSPINVRDTLVRASRLIAVDRVLHQQPSGSSALPPDSMRGKVSATIWIRRAASVVPDVKGMRLTTAQDRIRDEGLRMGDITTETTGISSRHGRVAETSPRANSLVPKDTRVKVQVYRYYLLPGP